MANGHGGARLGTPGVAYPNRSDLSQNKQPLQAPTGMAYGQHKAAIDAQRAVGLPEQQDPAAGLIGLHAPTQRPNEPIHAGMPTGPGPGPEALGLPPGTGTAPTNPVADQLRALYLAYPNSDLAALIEDYNTGWR